LANEARATLRIDLRPDMPASDLAKRLARRRPGQSMSDLLRRAVNLSPVETNLLREVHGVVLPSDPAVLAAAIKACPIALTGVQGLARAISTAGGVRLDAVDDDLALAAIPDVFVAGEMLDWEAPTGGYLLQATFATGLAAARGVLRRLT
jgi:predicted flavoprotein YhiN